ncbi:peptidase of plants and bacteria-domain-containing protein [Morchella snyderi]|nr:peptidase of plants and bacteria-domain-containing protein [Morchella snyderi]
MRVPVSPEEEAEAEASMQSTRPFSVLTQMSPVPTHAPEAVAAATATSTSKRPKKEWQIPKLLFKCKDVAHPGAAVYFAHSNTASLLRDAVVGVLESLYTFDTAPNTQRSVTLILRDMDGVAYTTSSDLDVDHKEIHVSLKYLSTLSPTIAASEILGVIRHEMVHCFQYNAHNTCPGGLIEGIADWVRLKAGFTPPHWRRGGKHWDDGYQNTAYFLEWLEQRFGEGTVARVNGLLGNGKYKVGMWEEVCSGCGVESLWEEYRKLYGIGGP